MGYKDGIKRAAVMLPIKSGKVLVTGATGLIGSCCIDVLLYAKEYLESQFEIYALGRNRKKI